MDTNLTGASFLANQFRTMIADAKAKLARAGEDMAVAVDDLHATTDHAVAQVRIVQKETADLKAALGLNSNGPPDEFVPTHTTQLPAAPRFEGAPIPTKIEYETPAPVYSPTPVTKIIEYETPAPFYGPAKPFPPHDDTGHVETIQLINGAIGTKING